MTDDLTNTTAPKAEINDETTLPINPEAGVKNPETIQEMYERVVGVKVPNNKKSDIERLQKKIDEAGLPKEPAVNSNNAIANEKAPAKIVPTELKSIVELQQFYGITTDELYNADILVKKYKLGKDQLAMIKEFTQVDNSSVELHFSFVNMPDYIQTLFHKYGVTPENIKLESSLTTLICGTNEPTDLQLEEIHQLTAYYNKMLQEKITNMEKPLENPALQK